MIEKSRPPAYGILRGLTPFACALLIALSLASAPCAYAQDRGLSTIAKGIVGPEFEVGRQYAVIIGIDRYDQWPSLKSAAAEARDVRRVLAERYYVDEFFELYDRDATAAGIRRLFLDTLPKKVGLKDSLFIFYAGHGYLDESKTGFWIASDGDKDVYSQRGWIPNAQLRNYVAGLKVQRVLLVADACFSGDFLNVTRGAGPTVDSAYFKKALSLTARQVLTSGSSETVPDESEFGRQLVSVLERNTEGVLDPHTMFDRIRRGVTKTEPLIGTIPGNEAGATFALFLKPKSGTLTVSVATAADVYVDGRMAGRASPGTPLAIADLASGQRRIEAKYASSSEARMVSIESGIVAEAAFAYTPPVDGSLSLSGFPEGSVVFVDGRKIGQFGKSAITVDGLSSGKHKARVEYWLWPAPSEYEVSVIPGARAALDFAGGSIIVRGLPRGISVFFNGALAGASVKTDDEVALGPLPMGTYSLRFEGVAWERLEQSVLVPSGGDIVVVPSLKPAKSIDSTGIAAAPSATAAGTSAKPATSATAESIKDSPRSHIGVGYLTLTSDPPGISVLVDEGNYILTPSRLELAPGQHLVKVKQTYLDGAYYSDKPVESVTVPDGAEIELVIKPERGLSVFDLSLVPPGYAVKIEGQPVRVTPLGKIGVKAGRVSLEFEKKGEAVRSYSTVALPDAIDRVPWGDRPEMALRLIHKNIDLKNIETWQGVPPVLAPVMPLRGGGVLSHEGLGVTALYMCRDDKYIYWRIDFESSNPLKKLPRGTLKAISAVLRIADGTGSRIQPELSAAIDNSFWNSLGKQSGKKYEKLIDQFHAFHLTPTTATLRFSIISLAKYVPAGVREVGFEIGHHTGSGWESGAVRSPKFYVDFDW